MLEIEHFCPWVAEVRNPRNPGSGSHLHRNQMHRMGRPCTDNDIHRILFQILLQKAHRRPYPGHPRVRDEQIAPEHKHQFLLESPLPVVDGVHLLHTAVLTAHKPAIQGIELHNRPFDYNGFRRDISLKASVHGSHFRVLRSVNDRLPAVLRQVFGEFHPPLHAGPSGRRPVICDDQNFFHINVPKVTIKIVNLSGCGEYFPRFLSLWRKNKRRILLY